MPQKHKNTQKSTPESVPGKTPNPLKNGTLTDTDAQHKTKKPRGTEKPNKTVTTDFQNLGFRMERSSLFDDSPISVHDAPVKNTRDQIVTKTTQNRAQIRPENVSKTHSEKQRHKRRQQTPKSALRGTLKRPQNRSKRKNGPCPDSPRGPLERPKAPGAQNRPQNHPK